MAAKRDPRVDNILDILERQAQAQEANNAGNNNLLEKFLKLKPSKFGGSGDPEVAEKWMEEIEDIFEAMPCTDAEKLTLATYVLEDNAKYWWKTTRNRVFPEGTEPLWTEFVRVFFTKYFTDCNREKKIAEFVQLVQGNMTVDKYEANFTRLSRFAPRLVEHAEDKAKKFLYGLKQEIRSQLVPLNLKNFDDIYERAQLVEQELIRSAAERSSGKVNAGKSYTRVWKKSDGRIRKRRNVGSSYQRGWNNQGRNNGKQLGTIKPQKEGNIVRCFHCGQLGHVRRVCPQLMNPGKSSQVNNVRAKPRRRLDKRQLAQRPQAQGTVHAITREDVE